MPKRIAVSTLNASTVEIINTIRQNASPQYQSLVPAVEEAAQIPKVGEVLWGYPNLANEFLSSLINRIALVRAKSATFNNKFARLKKGMLEYGETVEEVFVELCKVREFSAEKAASREFKRSLPEVRAAFHAINWKVQYPITIQQEELKQAFLSADGVTSLITKIIDSCYVAAEYDEYLLFKYLIIKAVSHGKMYPIAFDASDMKNSAKKFRGISNKLEFIDTKYNEAHVHTNTNKADQSIFMGAEFNADYDVDVLASAFNMDKATFMGNLQMIDDFTTFDNDRWAEIRTNCDGIEEVTSAELSLMADVKAVLVDEEWFQIYDNLVQFTEAQVSSGMYWNYFLNVWKTVSSSPFSNAIVFVDDGATTSLPDTFIAELVSLGASEESIVANIVIDDDNAGLVPTDGEFVQTEDAVEELIAVHKYGSIVFGNPASYHALEIHVNINGTDYVSCTRSGTSPSYTYTEKTCEFKNGETGALTTGDEIMFCKSSLITT